MLHGLIIKVLSWLFPATIKVLVANSEHQGYLAYIESRKKFRDNEDDFLIKEWQDKPVIFFGNEWEDPVIGHVVGPLRTFNTSEPMAAVKNVLNDQTYHTWYSSLKYADYEMVTAVLKLNPFERWNLYTRAHVNMWSKGYPNGSIRTPKEIMDILESKDFFKNQIKQEETV